MTSGHVLPGPARRYPPYRVGKNAEHASNLVSRNSLRTHRPDAPHFFFGHFGHRIPLPASVTVLDHAVLDIHLMGPKPKMVRVYASWVVAAMNHALLVGRDVTGRKKIRYARSPHRSMVQRESPAATRDGIPEPEPTVGWIGDVGQLTESRNIELRHVLDCEVALIHTLRESKTVCGWRQARVLPSNEQIAPAAPTKSRRTMTSQNGSALDRLEARGPGSR